MTTTNTTAQAANRVLRGVRHRYTPARLVEELLVETPYCGDHHTIDDNVPVEERVVPYYFWEDAAGTTVFEIIINWSGYDDKSATSTADPAEVASAKELLGVDLSAHKSAAGSAKLGKLFQIAGLGPRLKDWCGLNHIKGSKRFDPFVIELHRPDLKLSDVVKAFSEFPIQSPSYAAAAMPSLDFLGFEAARVKTKGMGGSSDVMLLFPKGQKDKIARRFAKIEPSGDPRD